jgi:hypothetical protein
MADVIIVKGGAASPRVRRSNSSSYGGGFMGLNQEEMLLAGGLVVVGLVGGYFAMQYVHTNPSLDWSDMFTPPYSINPPAKVPPTIVQSAYTDVAPEPEQIEQMDASLAVTEGDNEFGAGSVIVEEPVYEEAPEAASYSVQRYETMRDNQGELIGLSLA